jgi:hypothetical protein
MLGPRHRPLIVPRKKQFNHDYVDLDLTRIDLNVHFKTLSAWMAYRVKLNFTQSKIPKVILEMDRRCLPLQWRPICTCEWYESSLHFVHLCKV